MNSDIEAKWQRAWREAKIFEPKLDNTRPKFFITVPYPYANGPLHIGHGRAYTVGDVVARYKRAEGYNVLFPMAFHVSGMPILAISDLIRKKDANTIKNYTSYLRLYNEKAIDTVLKSFETPENVALYFANKIKKDFDSIGLSLDWCRQFHTAEKIYNKFIEWQFRKLQRLNLLKKGEYPLTYSIKDKNPVGEDDIQDGDTDKVSILEFVSIKFGFEDGYILASTLRPETIFGITNLWVDSNGDYAKIKIADTVYFVSQEAYEKLKYQLSAKITLLKSVKGTYFINKHATVPALNKTVLILPATFLDTDNATGFVYSVPAHAPYDLMGLKDLKNIEEYKNLNIQPISIIDVPNYSAIPAEDICARLHIQNQQDPKLEEATKLLYRDEFYNGMLNKNCGKFQGLKIAEIKDKIKNWLITNNYAMLFYEVSRKAVTRSGNKVIVAVVHGQWFVDYKNAELKHNSHKLVDRMSIWPLKYKQQFHEIIEWLRERPCVRKRGLGTAFPFDKRWVIESLSDSTIYMALYTIIDLIRTYQLKPEQFTYEAFEAIFFNKPYDGPLKPYIKNMQDAFRYWYPNDLRVTGTAHLSNHLAFFIMNHAALFQEQYWPKGILLIGMLIRAGVKMSKSKGNLIPLSVVAKQYSADLYRLYIISTADLDAELDWRESEIEGLKRKFEKFETLVNDAINAKKLDEFHKMDRWIISRFYDKLKIAKASVKNFKFRTVVIELFFNFLNDLKYYEKREGSDRKSRVLKELLPDWIVMLSPIIPHIAEEYWHKMGNDQFIALTPMPKVHNEYINPIIETEVDYTEKVLADIKNILKVIKIHAKNVYIYTVDRSQKLATAKNTVISEANVLNEAKSYIEREVNLKIIINGDYDPMHKRHKARPNKPAIYIE